MTAAMAIGELSIRHLDLLGIAAKAVSTVHILSCNASELVSMA
jgi:hypothetical protein